MPYTYAVTTRAKNVVCVIFGRSSSAFFSRQCERVNGFENNRVKNHERTSRRRKFIFYNTAIYAERRVASSRGRYSRAVITADTVARARRDATHGPSTL